MAGETVKSRGVCLAVHPWSRTSHIVVWLTPAGTVRTSVKGANRPKSAFLGQYDLNYTCEIVYYARGRGDIHALRECTPLELRETLRGSYRRLAAADHCRHLAEELAPAGADCREWMSALEKTLAGFAKCGDSGEIIAEMLDYELKILSLSGLSPDFSGYSKAGVWSSFSVEEGRFNDNGRRVMRIRTETAKYLECPREKADMQILLDAARVIGVFYQFHLGCASDVRRMALRMISTTKQQSGET